MNLKKLLASMLCLAMILNFSVISVFAEEGDEGGEDPPAEDEWDCAINGHDWSNGECMICGAVCDHPSFETYIDEPDCEHSGCTYMNCTVCDYGYAVEGSETPALGHIWEQSGTVEPTCEEPGYIEYTCSRCNKTKREPTEEAALGHIWVEGSTVPPTCTEQGYTNYTCSRCNATKRDNFADATGHNFVNNVCTVCGADRLDVYTLYSGFTATGGQDGNKSNSNESYPKLVDGKKSTKWCTISLPRIQGQDMEWQNNYIYFNANEAFVPKAYILCMGNDVENNPNRLPSSWTLKARNKTTDNWTVISNVTNASMLEAVNCKEYTFSLSDNHKAYKYFYFEVQGTRGREPSNDNWIMELSELELFGAPDVSGVTFTHTDAKAATCTQIGYSVPCYIGSNGRYYADAYGEVELSVNPVIAPLGHDYDSETYICHRCGEKGRCTINFLPGAASGQMSPMLVDFMTDYELPVCTFTIPTGKRFAGWQVGNEILQPGQTVNSGTEDADITAVVEVVNYSVTTNIKSGRGSITLSDGPYNYNKTVRVTVTPEDGYLTSLIRIFYVDENNVEHTTRTLLNPSNSINYFTMPAADTIVEVSFLRIEASVKYWTNMQASSIYACTCYVGDSHVLMPYMFSFTPGDDVEFLGWIIDDSVYQPGDEITVTGDLTIRALWNEDKTISFQKGNSNATGSMPDVTVTAGNSYTLPESKFKRNDGYLFDGWSVRGTTYQPGDVITVLDDTTVSALWVKGCKITFDKGGDEISGSMAAVYVKPGSEYTLPSCAFTGRGVFTPSLPNTTEHLVCMTWKIGTDSTEYPVNSKITVNEDITLTPGKWGEPWACLRNILENPCSTDLYVKLDRDIGPFLNQAGDTTLAIKNNLNVVLDLNGHTINRGLTSATNYGGIFMVYGGNLTVIDSAGGGSITGGYTNSSAITGSLAGVSGGTFTLEGGTVSGNNGPYVVNVANNGKFEMKGGTITDNGNSTYINISRGTAELSGGSLIGAQTAGIGVSSQGGTFSMSGGTIYGMSYGITASGGSISLSGGTVTGSNIGVSLNSTALSVSGDPQITGNRSADISLPSGSLITVSDKLDKTARIGVKPSATPPLVVTDGLSGKGTASNFVCNNTKYAFGINSDGEAYIASPVTVSFAANGGGGSMASEKIATDSIYTFPECAFTPPENTEFDCWMVGSTRYYAGDTLITDEDITLTAQWIPAVSGTLTSADGREITYKFVPASRTVEIVGGGVLSDAEPVLVWSYDACGMLLRSAFITRENVKETAVADGAEKIKIAWWKMSDFMPNCRNAEINITN